ncbi:hypothetical protein Trydic_g1021 [Trypoxylus dichotomus]
MDKVIAKLPKPAGYKMGNTYFDAVCYANDTVVIADSEDNLQRSLHFFNQSVKQLNMTINTDKTKCLVTSKEPVRCKLAEQVNRFKYLGTDIKSFGNRDSEVQEQTMKASQISGCLRDIVCKAK